MRDVRRKNLHAIWRKFKYIHIFIIYILFLDVHGFVKFKIEYTERINQKFNETKSRVIRGPMVFFVHSFYPKTNKNTNSQWLFLVLLVGGR